MGEREREDTIALKKIRVEELMFRLTSRMRDEELNALVIDVMLNREKYKLNFEEDDPKHADLNAYLKIVSLYYNVRYEGHNYNWAKQEWWYLLTRRKW
jgi:hypothetical protein